MLLCEHPPAPYNWGLVMMPRRGVDIIDPRRIPRSSLFCRALTRAEPVPGVSHFEALGPHDRITFLVAVCLVLSGGVLALGHATQSFRGILFLLDHVGRVWRLPCRARRGLRHQRSCRCHHDRRQQEDSCHQQYSSHLPLLLHVDLNINIQTAWKSVPAPLSSGPEPERGAGNALRRRRGITGLLYLSCDAAGKAFSGPGNLSYFGDIPSHLHILPSTDYEQAMVIVGGISQMAFVCPEPSGL